MRASAATSPLGGRMNWRDIAGWFQWRIAQQEAVRV
jgi:hypothetical protein